MSSETVRGMLPARLGWEAEGDDRVRHGDFAAALKCYQAALRTTPNEPRLKYKVEALQSPGTQAPASRGPQ